MKRMTALFVAIALLACVLTGCAKAGFKADGTIKAKDEDGKLRSYRLVEIKKEDGQVNLFQISMFYGIFDNFQKAHCTTVAHILIIKKAQNFVYIIN